MTTNALLRNAGIRKAIVVDDGFDPVPTAADLVYAEDEWAVFFADLADHDQEHLREIYADFDEREDAYLQADDAFVQVLWENRDRFRKELVDPLFRTYMLDAQSDVEYLETVCDALTREGLEVGRVGRDFIGAADEADLIVIDLFLGSAQSQTDMRISIDQLTEVLKARGDNPPAIILMSRSTRLGINVDSFRDEAGAFSSGFRQIAKKDLAVPAQLEQLLRELARHRGDSLKLTGFLRAWRLGLTGAVERTAVEIRRLDLHDWAQIRDLLLSSEGVSTGCYILDVFDRVLMHEVERDQDTITAALQLNSLSEESYPPMTAAGSKDTLSLLSKTLYQHENRRQLDSPEACPISFGDIIGTNCDAVDLKGSIFENNAHTVFVVMTPACDLLRKNARRALLMAGSCVPVDAKGYRHSSGRPSTAVLTLSSGVRVRVDWDKSHIAALTFAEITALLADGAAVILGRLRNERAVALQQELLTGLGRVGQIAAIPLTEQVKVKISYPNTYGKLEVLTIGNHTSIQAVCFVGRDDATKVVRVPFDPEHRFDFVDALASLSDKIVHAQSWSKIKQSKNPSVIDFLLSEGITVDVSKPGPQDCKVPVSDQAVNLGKVIYDGTAADAFQNAKAIRSAGLVFEIVRL